MKKRITSLVLFVIVFTACEESITTLDDIETDPIGEERIAVFSKIQTNIFNQSCALSGCHAGGNAAAGMNLSTGVSYSNIVGVKSIFYTQLNRVTPGDTSSSVLLQVLRRNLTPYMPQTGSVKPELIDSLAVWIAEGAKNN